MDTRTNQLARDKALIDYLVRTYGEEKVKDTMFSMMTDINKTKNNSK